MKILKSLNIITLLFSSVFLLELTLPNSKYDGQVLTAYQPKSWKGYVNKEEYLIKTDQGIIKIKYDYHFRAAKGDSISLEKSPIYGISKSIYFHNDKRTVDTGNMLYSWFVFMPVLVLILSLITLLTKNEAIVTNFGGASVAIVIFVLYVLFKDNIR